MYDAMDDAEAERWFRRAADAGDTDAMTTVGVRYANSGQVAAAEPRLWRAANARHVKAMVNLAVLLLNAERADEAIHWAQQASRHTGPGDLDEMRALGEIFRKSGQSEEAI